MHIGFDISQSGRRKAGCGHFADSLITSLMTIAPEHRYLLFPSFGDYYFDPLMPFRNPYRSANSSYGPRHLTRAAAEKFWKSENLETALEEPDIIHANNFWCPLQLNDSRLVYTLHDMGFLVEPAWTTEANRLGCFDGVFRSSLAADWILAVSDASRNSYLKVFPHFPEERVRVIYPYSRLADSDRLVARPRALAGVPERGFWLSVGTIEPRKNQRRLAEAYARYREQGGSPMPLVFAGGKGWLMDDFERHLESLGIAADVIMTGYVSDKELIWLYRNCYAHLFSSLFEGFGLPVLEGMQFGAATLCSNTTSLPEVAGNAAVLLPPEDTAQWCDAMLKLTVSADGELERLRSEARRRAARFSWQNSARQLLQLYEEAVASPKRSGMGR